MVGAAGGHLKTTSACKALVTASMAANNCLNYFGLWEDPRGILKCCLQRRPKNRWVFNIMPFYIDLVLGRKSCIKAIMLLTRHHGFDDCPGGQFGICKHWLPGHEVKPTF